MQLLAVVFIISLIEARGGILYPRDTETREIFSLDGIWNFALTDPERHDTKWYMKDFQAIRGLDVDLMAVPSSYNDVGTGVEFRDHVGLVWYQRNFVVPKSWSDKIVWIRFASVSYAAEVRINGEIAVTHSIGHLPFQADVSSLLVFGGQNVITVAVDNTLTDATIPEGSVTELSNGRLKQTLTFDFFNYAGIDRPVVLYTTPTTYIDDITISTDIGGGNGFVNYAIAVEGSETVTAKVTLYDKEGNKVVSDTVLTGTLFVEDALFWWPYLMNPTPGYLYSLEVQLFDSSGSLLDKYTTRVGIRTIAWDSEGMTINNQPIYLRGFGRHEDADVKGKGLDLPLILRDHNLIKWIGANAYRTSHYPYAEEVMDLTDQLGIMIIDESPATSIEHCGDEELLENHKRSITEMIQRDKNRPSVIMWSASNEPACADPVAQNDHFREVFTVLKSLDSSRPATITFSFIGNYQGLEFLDIISINYYEGWYTDIGDLDLVASTFIAQAKARRETFNKPILITEYGADTLEGLHLLPSYAWAEEYQDALLSKHFEAFDQLRKEDYLLGEMIWAFSDFNTDQQIYRVGGNKKGIFTRNREPKASAHLLRKRYWALAEALDNVTAPGDLNSYIIDN